MTLLRQSLLPRLVEPSAFFWAAGIEDTFITAPWPRTGRTLDEYELTGHYERWFDDLGLLAEAGVGAARYGLPWHRVNPRPGVWDWSLVDHAMDRLLALGIEPIVDLVHYGLPPWIEGAYDHPDYPRFVAEYASRTAQRLQGRVFAYTPLNEPRITAWYCGRLGWWPPFARGWRGFVRVMLAVCRGIIATVGALQAVDSDIAIVHVDATDLYRPAGAPPGGATAVPPGGAAGCDPELAQACRHRQEIVFLALDLISGRMNPAHPLWPWLLRLGAGESDLAWLHENAIPLSLIGLNLYPMFTLKAAHRAGRGGVRWRMPYAGGEIIDALAARYWERYQVPVFISETASVGPVRRRRQWLDDSIAAVRRARAAGVPVVGYTWWPLFALVTWAYRQGRHPPAYYLRQMGLWDLGPDLRRERTALVDAYRELTRGGAAAVGDLPRPGPAARLASAR